MRPRPTWLSRNYLALSAVAVLSACLVAACSSTTTGTTKATSSPTTAKPILIGASLSLTGDFSADGQAFDRGYKLWASDVNASGGLLGKGLGGGQPYITPLVQSDLVFTAFGEEIGLAGLMAILLIYGLIVERGLRTAISVKDPFSKLLAGGLSFMLALQVFVIVGGVTRLIPLTGITTPFLSQGGSSLVGSWILIALLARVSDTARRPPPRPIQDEGLTQVVTLK